MSSTQSTVQVCTQLSAVLCEGHINSVKHMVLLFGDHYGAFGQLAEGVRSGQTPYKLWSGGLGHWEHMAKQPELQGRFNKCVWVVCVGQAAARPL